MAREDNKNLATAGREIVQALNLMAERGWTDDETAVRVAFKFMGEVPSDEQIAAILAAGPAGEKPEQGNPNHD